MCINITLDAPLTIAGDTPKCLDSFTYIVMEMISSIDLNLTKIDERQITLKRPIDVNDVKWLEWTSIYVKIFDASVWRFMTSMTYFDIYLRFMTISIFENFRKIFVDVFWRFYNVLWRCRQFWYNHLTSNDVKWRQMIL